LPLEVATAKFPLLRTSPKSQCETDGLGEKSSLLIAHQLLTYHQGGSGDPSLPAVKGGFRLKILGNTKILVSAFQLLKLGLFRAQNDFRVIELLGGYHPSRAEDWSYLTLSRVSRLRSSSSSTRCCLHTCGSG
jgi:hypothetical protein